MNQFIALPEDLDTVRMLHFLTKSYDGLNRYITSTKNRIQHLKQEERAKRDERIVKPLESIKGKLSRDIESQLFPFYIYRNWLKDIPGVGPWIAAALIKEYYYRFVPLCKKCGADMPEMPKGGNGADGEKRKAWKCIKCGAKAKGEGIIESRIERKDFPKISSWWSYMGMGVVDGKKDRVKSGESKGGRRGRAIAYQLGEQFIKQNGEHPYRAFYDRVKAKRERTHPDASKLHKHNMAKHEAAKLFLAHFWMVARELEGLEVTEPYAGKLLKHNVIQPYFWDSSQPTDVCHTKIESHYNFASQA